MVFFSITIIFCFYGLELLNSRMKFKFKHEMLRFLIKKDFWKETGGEVNIYMGYKNVFTGW